MEGREEKEVREKGREREFERRERGGGERERE